MMFIDVFGGDGIDGVDAQSSAWHREAEHFPSLVDFTRGERFWQKRR